MQRLLVLVCLVALLTALVISDSLEKHMRSYGQDN